MPSVIKAAKLGDAAIIKAIIKILSYEKIKVISSTHFNPELNAKKGIFTKSPRAVEVRFNSAKGCTTPL